MKTIQIWIGEVIPNHVLMCYKSLAKYAKEDSDMVFITDRYREDIPEVFNQVFLDTVMDAESRHYLNLLSECNIATKVDYIRYTVLSLDMFKGYTYVDSDILMVRDPSSLLSADYDTVLYRETPTDFSCIGVISNGIEDNRFIKHVRDQAHILIESVIGTRRKIKVKDLMFLLDECRKEGHYNIDLRDHVHFFKISYGVMCRRIAEGALWDKDLKAISEDTRVKGIHLWRPENMPRTNAHILDEFAEKFLSLDLGN